MICAIKARMETMSDFSFCELIDLSSSIHEFPAQFSSIPVSVVSLQPALGSADTVHISPLLGAQKCNCSCFFYTKASNVSEGANLALSEI